MVRRPCPAASVVGTTSFTSPLVGTLSGTVYEGEPEPGQMLRLFVDVPGPGLRIKLIGNVDPDPSTGQITSTFSNLPQLPFTAFALKFRRWRAGDPRHAAGVRSRGQQRRADALQRERPRGAR